MLSYWGAGAARGDVKMEIRDRQYSPEEISALILREIKEIVEESLQEEISEAVITVPAHFGDSQRQATQDAGQIAGLDALRILNQPTAPAPALRPHPPHGHPA